MVLWTQTILWEGLGWGGVGAGRKGVKWGMGTSVILSTINKNVNSGLIYF